MTPQDLPPLPRPCVDGGYTADQMRSYALAAVEAARPKWLPIETAPKDGTLLLVVNDSRIAMAHRITSDLVWYQFVSGVPMLFHPVLAFEPTHWQPLPAAPSQE